MKKKHTNKKLVNQFFYSLPKAYPYYFKNKKFYKNNYEKTITKNFLSSYYFVGLRSVESTYITHNSLEACLKFLKKFAGIYYGVCGLKFKLLIFPDF
jgi:ribosomal protein L16/L10AE